MSGSEVSKARLSINLHPPTVEALAVLCEKTGLTQTDIVNRAIQIYGLRLAVAEPKQLAPGTYELTKRVVVEEGGRSNFVDMPDGPHAEHVAGFWHRTRSRVRRIDGASADCAASAGAQVAREQATDRAAITVAEQDAMEQAAWEAVERSGWGEATAPAAVAVAVEGVIEYLRRSDFDRIDRPNLSPELVEVADLLWEQAHGAPPLDQDPVARRLGIVSEGE